MTLHPLPISMRLLLGIACWLTTPLAASAEDVIEFLSGAKARGQVLKINTQEKTVDFEVTISGKTLQRLYPYASIHAVTYKGKRYVLNEMSAATSSPPKTSSTKVAEKTAAPAATNVEALIADASKSAPDWYEATALNYPQSLDLSWPDKPPGGWNNQKNIGQFIWDVINPNPGRWREGIRFLHYLLEVHAKDAVKLRKVQIELGRMYFELLQDYPRAAFWYRRAGIGQGIPQDSTRHGAHLAECYFRMGNKKMAVDLMNKLPVSYAVIKLWGDLGDTKKCVQLATASASRSQLPAMYFLVAGDAYRMIGDYKNALAAYQQSVQASQQPTNQARQQKLRERAQNSIRAIESANLIDLKRIADGSYRSASNGYEGPVEVEVRVAAGKIEEVRVTQHKEKQFYSSIEDTTTKIVKKQGVAGVDTTSGATITSEAIINASAKALADGTK